MAESEKERRARVDREIAASEKARKNARIQASLDAAAAEERTRQRMNQGADDLFAKQFDDLFGASMQDVQRNILPDSDDARLAKRILGEAQKLSKGSPRKQAKAVKLVKQNKNLIKKSTKKSGCAVVGLALIGGLGATGWAIYEAGSSLVSALGH
jgi:hypothetical protein